MARRGGTGPPPGHVVARVLLSGLVVSLVAWVAVLAVLRKSGELAFGYDIWQAVKNWALP